MDARTTIKIVTRGVWEIARFISHKFFDKGSMERFIQNKYFFFPR